MLGKWRMVRVGSAPLAFAGDEFVDLLEEESDHPEDGFDFDEHCSLVLVERL
jgi:hypothetical protein